METGERFNSITHIIGAALALCGLAVLVTFASLQGDPWKIVSFSVYGVTLLLLYTASALYHSLNAGPAKNLFQTVDHISIYLLIAGTYTPFTLVALRGPWGWSLFGSVWLLALIGIALELRPIAKSRAPSVAIYLFMGWLILVAINPLLAVLPGAGVFWLILGGSLYSVGVIFYVFSHRIRHFHGIWHLFVLAGSISHFWAIIFYVNSPVSFGAGGEAAI
ncbi:hemolysin III family protein [Pelagicoccus sp. SDUM812003]|uniref:PAQR family membrane homeostasis protein TrhA n=1 Tax=Pelagicoccus sp. SDUM812003 TaxID=3041267 RepID=UPI00280FF612|nr:hemolysin III family protein [Pelagicoccus sp. SDUM812003]MDQ8204739.1 hemolysin III family protein [Pelagicoccus sp. SDUM812003]